MSKYSLKTALLVALVLILASAGAAFAAEGDTLVTSGAIEALGDGRLTVDGVTMTVDDSTRVTGAPGGLSVADLTVGMRVVAVAVEQADKSLLAKEIVVLLDPTPEPTEEPSVCHPVALLIGAMFGETCADIEAMHDSGIGFGVIGRAYLTAAALDGEVTAEQLIELHQSGAGWGEIMKQYDVHPGGKGLGAIMSGRFAGATPTPEPNSDGGWKPGNNSNPPGQTRDKAFKRGPGR